MSTSANVHSLESIEAVRRALALFDEQVSNALTELGAEMRRLLDWLEHDRPRHWKTQVRIATDQVHQAQQALNRCLMFPIANERPSCYEERAELKKAQAKLEYAREKQDRVRHWQQSVQHELFEYEGRISQLVRLIDADLPQAKAVLARIIRHLEDYQSLRSGKPSTAYSDIAMVREIWSEDIAEKDPIPSSEEPAAEIAGDRNDLPASTRIESEP